MVYRRMARRARLSGLERRVLAGRLLKRAFMVLIGAAAAEAALSEAVHELASALKGGWSGSKTLQRGPRLPICNSIS